VEAVQEEDVKLRGRGAGFVKEVGFNFSREWKREGVIDVQSVNQKRKKRWVKE